MIQPLIDQLWDFHEPAESESRFRNAALQATTKHEQLELLTQVARALGLQKKFAEAHAQLDEVRACIDADPDFSLDVDLRYLLECGRIVNSAKQPSAALPVFEQAFEVARKGNNDHLTIDAAHMIAIVHDALGDLTAAEDWNHRALRLAEESQQPRARRWRGSLLNNLGWSLHNQGRFEEALTAFERAFEHRVQYDSFEEQLIARWCMARCLRSLGRDEESLNMQRQIEREREQRHLPADPYVSEEIAACLKSQK